MEIKLSPSPWAVFGRLTPLSRAPPSFSPGPRPVHARKASQPTRAPSSLAATGPRPSHSLPVAGKWAPLVSSFPFLLIPITGAADQVEWRDRARPRATKASPPSPVMIRTTLAKPRPLPFPVSRAPDQAAMVGMPSTASSSSHCLPPPLSAL